MVYGTSSSIGAIYCGISGLALLLHDRSDRRARRLTVPLWLNFAIAGLTLLLLSLEWRTLINILGSEHQELYLGLFLIGLFTLCVEIPGYMLNLNFDNNVAKLLDKLEEHLLTARVKPSTGISQLRVLLNSEKNELADTGILQFLSRCVQHFEQINNIDPTLVNILQRQLETKKAGVQSRSKHPAPLIVQIFGLSGVAFLIAEILANLRAR